MSRMYTVVFQGTITNAGGDQDLLECDPAAGKPVRLRGFSLGNISEVGDSAEEGLRCSVYKMTATVTGGSGGSAPTVVPLDTGDAAFGGAVEVNNTTVATTSGSALILHELGWNIRGTPYDFWYPDERFCPIVREAEFLLFRLQTTPADDFTGQFTFWLEEL